MFSNYLFKILLTVNTLLLRHYHNCDSDRRRQTLDLKAEDCVGFVKEEGYLDLNNREELWEQVL